MAQELQVDAKPSASAGYSEFERTEWRLLIEDEPRSGPANMAIDHALALACAAGESPPTLRFYRWNPPAVSIGRNQPAAEIDLDMVSEHGFDIVRRTTGGRAILHIDELTYSIVAPRNEPRVQGAVMDTYLRLSNGLLAGLTQLGVHADKAGADVRTGKDVSAACFEVPSAYEITVNGRKLMGSAQSRKRDFVLQHGSLPLNGDIARLIDLLALAEAEKRLLRGQLIDRACTLSDILPAATASITFNDVAQALSRGFAQVLNLDFGPVQRNPSNAEIAQASQLIREQYGKDSWTFSR